MTLIWCQTHNSCFHQHSSLHFCFLQKKANSPRTIHFACISHAFLKPGFSLSRNHVTLHSNCFVFKHAQLSQLGCEVLWYRITKICLGSHHQRNSVLKPTFNILMYNITEIMLNTVWRLLETSKRHKLSALAYIC